MPARSGQRAATSRVPRRREVAPRVGFWFAAASFTVLMALGTSPIPLWPLYEVEDRFGVTTVTVVFGMLVVGAAIGFLALGHLSDRIGRRRVVAGSLAVGVLAAVVMAVWSSLPGLLTGRLLNGIGVGMMASTATAYLHDLYRSASTNRTHPNRETPTLPAAIATAANIGGLALGALTGGVLATWTSTPLVTVPVVFAVAMAMAFGLTLSSPETVGTGPREYPLPARFRLRPRGGVAFAASAALAFLAFAIFGVFSALGPNMLRGVLHIQSPLIAGLATFLMMSAAAVAQLALTGLPLRGLLISGVAVGSAGAVLAVVAVARPALGLYLAAVTIAGAGAGLMFRAGLVRASAVAAPESRAGVLAIFYVVAYLGMGVPAVLLGVALGYVSLVAAMTGFAVLLACGGTVAASTVGRAPGASAPDTPGARRGY